jgi:hypothetical protein
MSLAALSPSRILRRNTLAPMNPVRRYVDRRRYVVPASLDELTGPVDGVVELPRHLDWSEQRVYDLADAAELGLMYERVIREAATIEDLRTYIDASTLVRVWPRLYLPEQARRAWEGRFPQLPHAA